MGGGGEYSLKLFLCIKNYYQEKKMRGKTVLLRYMNNLILNSTIC